MRSGRLRGASGEPSAPATNIPGASPADPASGSTYHLSCVVDEATLGVVDMLVEAGARPSRSAAAAWLIGAGIEAQSDLIAHVRATVEELRRLQAQTKRLREEAFALANEVRTADGVLVAGRLGLYQPGSQDSEEAMLSATVDRGFQDED